MKLLTARAAVRRCGRPRSRMDRASRLRRLDHAVRERPQHVGCCTHVLKRRRAALNSIAASWSRWRGVAIARRRPRRRRSPRRPLRLLGAETAREFNRPRRSSSPLVRSQFCSARASPYTRSRRRSILEPPLAEHAGEVAHARRRVVDHLLDLRARGRSGTPEQQLLDSGPSFGLQIRDFLRKVASAAPGTQPSLAEAGRRGRRPNGGGSGGDGFIRGGAHVPTSLQMTHGKVEYRAVVKAFRITARRRRVSGGRDRDNHIDFASGSRFSICTKSSSAWHAAWNAAIFGRVGPTTPPCPSCNRWSAEESNRSRIFGELEMPEVRWMEVAKHFFKIVERPQRAG